MRLDRVLAAIGLALAFLSTGPAAAEKLAVTQYGRITASLPWAVAMKKGFFKEEGLDIDEIVSGAGGGTALRNMMATGLPYAEIATSTALAAIKSGLDLKIVNTASNHIGEIALVTLPGSPVRTIADLAGRKAGFTAPRSTSEMLLRMAFEKQGLAGRIELLPTGGFGPGLTMLSVGAVDATTLTDPVLTLQPDKYRPIFAFADFIPRISWLVGVATPQFAASQPDKLRALIRVRRKGVDFIYANRAEAAAIYAEIWETQRAEVDRFFPKYFDMPGEWQRGEFDKEGLAAMSAGLQLIGEIDKPVDWNAIIDQRFLPEDMRRPL